MDEWLLHISKYDLKQKQTNITDKQDSPVVTLTETGGPSLFWTRARTFTSYCAPSSNCLRSTEVTLPPTSWLLSSPPTIALTVLFLYDGWGFLLIIYIIYELWPVEVTNPCIFRFSIRQIRKLRYQNFLSYRIWHLHSATWAFTIKSL